MAPRPKFGKPDKVPNPVLLALVAQFLSNHGFKSSLRIYTTERQKRAKKGAFTDTYGAKQTVGVPQLDIIVKEYLEQNPPKAEESSSDDDSSSDESEAEEAGADVEMADAVSAAESDSEDESSSSSESTSDESSDDSEEEAPQPIAQPKSLKRKASSSSASSSSSSDSSESSASEGEKRPSKRTKVQPADPESDSESSASSSSSSSDSESESEAIAAAVPLPESDSSDSSSDSDSDSEPAAPVKQKEASDSSSDAESESSDYSSSSESSESSDESGSEEKEEVVTKQIPSVPTPANKLPRASSDSSATLQGDPAPLPPWPERKHKGARPTRLAELSASYDPNDPNYIDNTYVSYDYADRAYKDLSVTRGKGFTKEKNKKKRGSYRGGAIDTSGGKAFKFDD